MNQTELTDFATRYAAAWSSQNPVRLASFYNDRITDPVASPLTGRVEFRFFEFEVPRTVTLTPLQIVFQPGDPFEDLVGVLQSYSMFHPSDWIPTSMHVLVRLSHTGFYVAMSHWQATVVELRDAGVTAHAVELIRFALYGQVDWPSLAIVLACTAVFLGAAIFAYNPSKGLIARRGGPGSGV